MAEPANPAPKADEKPETKDEGLVTVHKGGDSLAVHPTCVEAHIEAGWEL